ncbi:MAG TPA: hypothetical protein VNS81_08055 [Nocardioides sp.]|nr:hypothetical protein [Nocardioides sp.]
MTMRARREALGALVVTALLVGLLVWWRWPSPDPVEPPAATPVVPVAPAAEPARPDPCDRQSARPFVPRTITLPGVVRRARVLAVPRDARGVLGVPPVATKDVVGWDLGGVRPGDPHGHVLLDAHTWPDGSALGNALLRSLRRDGTILLRGVGGQRACYRVAKRVEVPVEAGYPGWERADGPPRVVIVVCSGRRLGPGHWTHRTLWFAEPVRPGAAPLS